MKVLKNTCGILDSAKYIRTIPEYKTIVIWNGGHGVHVYYIGGEEPEEIHFFNVGDFSKNEADFREVKNVIDAYVKTLKRGLN